MQMLRDDRIKLRLVRAVLTDAEGGLGEVERRDDVLKRIDRSKERMQQGTWPSLLHTLVAVREANVWYIYIVGAGIAVDEQELSDFQCKELNLRPGTRVAVVKILNKKDAYDRDRAALLERKAKKKSTSFEEKEVQLTWGVSAHDLSHKLKKARQVLEKGGRVGLVVSSPKGSALPGREEREMFVRMVREMCGQEEGRCSTWKDELWRGGRTAVFLQGVRREGEGEAKSAEAP